MFFEGSCFRFLINCARERTDNNILLKLIYEIISLIKLDVSSLVWKKKKNIYLLALANKFYIKNL